MATKEKEETKTTAEVFTDLFKSFSKTVADILDDPEVKNKAREFSESVIDAATRVMENKVKGGDTRAKIREVGRAAETFGKKVEEKFKA